MLTTIKRYGKQAIGVTLEKYRVNRLHYYENTRALTILQSLEQQRGKIGAEQKKRSNEYAVEVLGDIKYSPWLYVYSAVRGNFVEGWIPQNYYSLILTPALNGEYHGIDNHRTLAMRILNTKAIPDTAYIINGILYSTDFIPVDSKYATSTIFKDSDIVFFKLNNSVQGKGVEKILKDDFKISYLSGKKDGCFQSIIHPHHFFKEITENSTSTIRITTVRDNAGKVNVRASFLRVGRKSDEMVKSASAVKIPIELSNGVLHDIGYMPDWRRSEKHPDSGFLYADKKIPYFENAKELCKSSHQNIPHLPIVGWDVSIDEKNEVKIMEWNAWQTGILFSEATTGPCFTGLGWENIWKNTKSNA